MNKNALLTIIVIILIAAGIYFISTDRNDVAVTETQTEQETANNTGTDTNTPTGMEVGVTAGVGTPGAVTVNYSDAGFSPATITVKQGTKVTFVNTGTKNMWVAADEHPTHTEYDGTSRTEHCATGTNTSFDQCVVGKTYTFAFNKVGTWEYHNHAVAGDTGRVIVTP
jgi:plastocyanin